MRAQLRSALLPPKPHIALYADLSEWLLAAGSASTPAFEGMASPQLAEWAESFGLRASGRGRVELAEDVRAAYWDDVAADGGGGEASVREASGALAAAPLPPIDSKGGIGEGAAARSSPAVAELGIEQSAAAADGEGGALQQQLALLIRANSALCKAAALLQPVSAPALAALAEQAGIHASAVSLQRELRALGVATRAEG